MYSIITNIISFVKVYSTEITENNGNLTEKLRKINGKKLRQVSTLTVQVLPISEIKGQRRFLFKDFFRNMREAEQLWRKKL